MKMKTKLCIVLAVIAMLASASIPPLDRRYANDFFTIDYPSTWRIAIEEGGADEGRAVVTICQKAENDYDFDPSVDVEAGSTSESISDIAIKTLNYARRHFGNCKLIRQVDDIVLAKAKGCMLEYIAEAPDGYTLRCVLYILKSSEDKTFVITELFDNDKYLEQKSLTDEIVKTFRIKRSLTESIGNIFR